MPLPDAGRASEAAPAPRGLEQIPWLYDAILRVLEVLCGLGRLRRRLVAGARGRVLDLGCGTGRNLPLYRSGGVIVGLDIEAASLRRARRRAPGCALVRASAEALPFRDGVFDTVVSGLVFCSVGSPAAGLAEVRRVLAPSGELRMLEHVRADVGWLARLQDRLQPWWTRVMGGCHPNRPTERTVEDAGFAIAPEDRHRGLVFREFVARRAP